MEKKRPLDLLTEEEREVLMSLDTLGLWKRLEVGSWHTTRWGIVHEVLLGDIRRCLKSLTESFDALNGDAEEETEKDEKENEQEAEQRESVAVFYMSIFFTIRKNLQVLCEMQERMDIAIVPLAEDFVREKREQEKD